MQEFVFYQINCEKGEGPAVAKKYDIYALPTFIAMNGKGEITDRWVGYGGPDTWSGTAIAAADDPRTIPEKKVAFDAAPSVELATSLANDAAAANDYRSAVGYLRQARRVDEANKAEYTHQILTNMYYGSRDNSFTFDEVETEAAVAMKLPETTIEQKIELASMVSAMARKTDESERAVPYLTAALQASEGNTDEGITGRRVTLEIEYALLVEKDEQKAVTLYRSTLDEGWQEDPGRLNQFAWWCFENDVNLAEAQTLALKGAELAESDSDRANILDTAAEICLKLGNYDEAIAHTKRAIELDPDKQYFQDQLVRFEKVLTDKSKG